MTRTKDKQAPDPVRIQHREQELLDRICVETSDERRMELVRELGRVQQEWKSFRESLPGPTWGKNG